MYLQSLGLGRLIALSDNLRCVKRRKLEKRLVVGYARGSRCDWAAVDIALDSSLKTKQIAAVLGDDWRIDIGRIPKSLPTYSAEQVLWRSIASLLDHQVAGPNLRILSEGWESNLMLVQRSIQRARGLRKPSKRWRRYNPDRGGRAIYSCECGEEFTSWPMWRKHAKLRHGWKIPVDPRQHGVSI